ncbi:MAG: replication-associated recombination protein A [Ilumatobacteraceae bacterium]|nr:replication-associated recombination protein A [Actinomycetota bacterium]MDP4642006.1 replication-associated recombination protein A [Ilumatobacteraceae bacterium]MDP4835301.1 replication-associated recombination protein A [Ilumatobacteraceae bacterium]MDP4973760.1 replication-associated recombination protein A [Ilumatobacteraceae bacterium]
MDLFTQAALQVLRDQAPLAARLRPRTLDDIVGQSHLLGADGPLRRLIESDRLSSIILWGPPGTGKTTIAEVIATVTSREFVRLSAVTSGVKDVREVIDAARDRLGQNGRRTIVFVDEIHRFNATQQDSLLPAVEAGLITLIGATTENPFFQVNAPLRSRSTLLRLEVLGDDDLSKLLERGAAVESATLAPEACALIVQRCGGDGRQALTSLEVAIALAKDKHVSLAHAEAALSTSALRYGRDDHYDVVSALIKSMRASDEQAALFWLARMIEAGDDPRFIARRLIVFASEDIGLADATALGVAIAAASAVEHVGLPEARYNLAHAVMHLAGAPKSRGVVEAIDAAQAALLGGASIEVPQHLRDGSSPHDSVIPPRRYD